MFVPNLQRVKCHIATIFLTWSVQHNRTWLLPPVMSSTCSHLLNLTAFQSGVLVSSSVCCFKWSYFCTQYLLWHAVVIVPSAGPADNIGINDIPLYDRHGCSVLSLACPSEEHACKRTLQVSRNACSHFPHCRHSSVLKPSLQLQASELVVYS